MKRNKKIMSIVAGAAIASQLLPVGTIIANAQTGTCIHGHHESKDNIYGYGNDMDIFGENGQDGINIKFDAKKDNALRVTGLGNYKNCLDKDNDGVYLEIVILDGSKGLENVVKENVRKTVFTFNGKDTIETVVRKLNAVPFKVGDGLQIHIAKSRLDIADGEKDRRVKISGFVSGTPGCYQYGTPKRKLDLCTFVIGSEALEYREYPNR